MGGGGVLHQQKPFLQQEVLVPRARSIRGSDGIGHTAGAHSAAPLRPDWDWYAKLLSGSTAEVSQAPPATRAALPFLSSPVLPKRDPVPACVILTKSLSWAIGAKLSSWERGVRRGPVTHFPRYQSGCASLTLAITWLRVRGESSHMMSFGLRVFS